MAAPKKPKPSPAQKAAKQAQRALKPFSNDQAAYEAGLPANVRRALEKGRADVGEVLDAFGEEIVKNIDPRGMGYGINMGDDTLAIYPDDDPAYAPASFTENEWLYEAPTSTSNPDRPRTVAAAYDPSRSVLTVVFRDSTVYNYYDVDETEWYQFRNSSSKGPYIRANLDSKPRGPANISDLPQGLRYLGYKGARAMQIRKGTGD